MKTKCSFFQETGQSHSNVVKTMVKTVRKGMIVGRLPSHPLSDSFYESFCAFWGPFQSCEVHLSRSTKRQHFGFTGDHGFTKLTMTQGRDFLLADFVSLALAFFIFLASISFFRRLRKKWSDGPPPQPHVVKTPLMASNDPLLTGVASSTLREERKISTRVILTSIPFSLYLFSTTKTTSCF